MKKKKRNLIQLHGFTISQVKDFVKAYEDNTDIIMNDKLTVHVDKTNGPIDVIHIYKK